MVAKVKLRLDAAGLASSANTACELFEICKAGDMITVNLSEARRRLSQLIKAIEEEGEVVILLRNGQPVAEIRPHVSSTLRPIRHLVPDPRLRPILAPGYDPTEPASEEEWPEDCR